MSLEIFHQHCSVRFEEPDIAAVIPACTPYVAAALAIGWRFSRDGAANHMDVLHGCKHLVDFKRASRKQLGRSIFFRFTPAVIVFEDHVFRVKTFIDRCQADRAFFRAAQRHPRYPRKLALLQKHLAGCARHLSVSEPEVHDRNLLVPMTGGDAEWIARLASGYESGF